MLTYVILLFVLLGLSAFFSSSETAFLTLQRVRLAHLVEENVPGARRVSALIDQPRRLLSAILLGNNLVNTAAAAVGTALAAELFVGGGAAVVIATVAVTVLLTLFGEVGPKTIALAHAFGLSRLYAWPMAAWIWLTRPATIALDALSRGLLRAVGAPLEQGDAISAAELRTAIRMGAQSGSIGSQHATHILGVMTLTNRQVQEIMVPRVDIISVEVTRTLDDAAALMANYGYQRIPVFEAVPEEVIGYLHVSDLNMLRVEPREDPSVREVMRPVQYESEHATIARVLDVMQEHASYLVMLVDEFGVTSGLVTLEDIMEEVVGELRSETGAEEVDEPPSADGPRTVEGSMLLVDLSNDLAVDLTDVDANTVAGLILFHLQRFPEPGETVEHEGVRFTVLERDERRIRVVAVERADEAV
ncbi:MAG: hemolysin family protein [Dehalococcoidia bacterium]